MLSLRVLLILLTSVSVSAFAEVELKVVEKLPPTTKEVLPDYSADPLFVPAAPEIQIKNASVRGFKEWKSEKVQEALARVIRHRTEIEQEKLKAEKQSAAVAFHEVMSGEKASSLSKTPTPVSARAKLEAQLKQSQFSLEVAKELAVTDYFALYLSQFPDKKKAFADAASKMTPDEVAELLNALEANSSSGSGAEKAGKVVRPASASLLQGNPIK